MPMIVGFTGTRHGMTAAQFWVVCEVLSGLLPIAEVHHGDCVGADADFHRAAACLTVHAHPPTDERLRAFCDADVVHEARPYLARDADIVAASTVLIACPGERQEQRRSGTWATVRMARKAGKPVVLIYSDGDVVRERWPGPSEGDDR
jgi:hypothetical protein